MSTAMHEGDESGFAGRRCAYLALGLLPMAVLLIGGCDAVLDINTPRLSARDGGLGALGEAGSGDDAGDEAAAGASGSDAPLQPDALAEEPECEDGALRCEDSSSGNRSKCVDGAWTAHEACSAKEQCDSQAGAACKPLPVEGESCKKGGSYGCSDIAKPERRFCDPDAMVWVETDPCPSGQVCDRTDGDCKPIVAACVGHMPGDFVCAGATRHTCGQDLTTSETHECTTAAHCQQSKAGSCAVCTQGEFMCVGAMLETCNAAGDGWMPMTTCESEALCNPMAGDCTTAPCKAGQHQCSGNQLEACNADLTGWESVEECADGLCDPVNGQCDVCSANTCDRNMRVLCVDGGQDVMSAACPRARPICTGAGECVQCTGPRDCAGGGGCTEASCVHNRCEERVYDAGARCEADHMRGECDEHGACRDGALAQLIPDTGDEGDLVTIRAKPGRCLHAPGLPLGWPALGISVTLSENGQTVPVEATVQAGSDGAQQVDIVMPPRESRWVYDEIVSVLVSFTRPASPEAGGGGTGGAGAGGAGGEGGDDGSGIVFGASCDPTRMTDQGALEFTYGPPQIPR